MMLLTLLGLGLTIGLIGFFDDDDDDSTETSNEGGDNNAEATTNWEDTEGRDLVLGDDGTTRCLAERVMT